MYFRDGSISSKLFAGAGQEIAPTEPKVANAAMRLAVALGFRRFALFGTDCGTRGERKHATGTSYEIDGVAPWYQPSLRFTIPVPANFGGTSHTDTFLFWSCKVLSHIAIRFGVEAVNCSDGALIEGIRPCRAADLVLAARDLDHRQVKAQIAATLPAYRPGQLVKPEMLRRLTGDAETLFAQLLGEVDAAVEGDEFESTWSRLIETVADPTINNLAAPILHGSLDALWKTSMYVIGRQTANDRQDELKRAVLTSLRGILLHCREQLATRVCEVAADAMSVTTTSS
jgi:hypothetical protein